MKQLSLEIFQHKHAMICQQYWHLETEKKFTHKVADIAIRFNLKSHQISTLVKSSSVAYSHTLYCENCATPYPLTRREIYTRHLRRSALWHCDHCLQETVRKQAEARQDQIFTFINRTQAERIEIDQLSLKEVVILFALIRHSGNESLTAFNPVESNKFQPLSPMFYFDRNLIQRLKEIDIMTLSHDTSASAFYFEEEQLHAYNPLAAIWQLASPYDRHLSGLLQQLEQRLLDPSLLQSACDDLSTLILEVSLMECFAYLIYLLDKYQLPFRLGEKSKNIFLNMLTTHSVAQIYRFIWFACRDSAAYYMRGGISKLRAANAVVGNLERQYERAIANSWTIEPFNRIHLFPQSALSQVLFNLILQSDDGGFTKNRAEMMDLIDLQDTTL